MAVCSVACASVAGYAAGSKAFSLMRRLRLSAMPMRQGDGLPAWVARNGVRPLARAAGALLRVPALREMAEELVVALRARELLATVESAMSLCLAGLVLSMVAAWAVSASAACAAAVGCCLAMAGVGLARTLRERREAAVRDAIPDVIRAMGVCFGAGMTLMQTMERVATEVEEPLRSVFEKAASMLETGGTTEEALAFLRQEEYAQELAFIAVALDVQHQSGGGVLPILDSAREAAQDEIDLQRSLRVQTAQAKLSARIVTVMPFVLIALFSLVSEGFLDPFFESAAGFALLCSALVMQASGVMAVRQMLKVDTR